MVRNSQQTRCAFVVASIHSLLSERWSVRERSGGRQSRLVHWKGLSMQRIFEKPKTPAEPIVSPGIDRESRAPERTSSQTQAEIAHPTNLLDKCVSWERGELDEEDTMALFQALVASGQAWHCTGPVRRTAALLIREGRIKRS
jgi:hypothetical protein